MKHFYHGLARVLFILLFLQSPLVLSRAQTRSGLIVVDQFGYLPSATKIAVIKDPQLGFDSWQSYSPGNTFAVVDTSTREIVFSGNPVVWNNGLTDASSGDKAWWFDFTPVTATGTYYVLDVDNNTRSFEFRVSPSVYNEVLKHAVRTFYYQRAGHAKEEPFAEKGWTDGASHVGPGQDKNARLFNDTGNPATEKDLSGGWYDAGDYNKYTSWTADYVVEMMLAYLERPGAWTDDYNIPESGNGIPDLLDEAKWGLDHLARLQLDNGSLISIVGLSHASPPSAATGPSKYGPPNTSATLTTAAAFAIGSRAFATIGMNEYADILREKAILAWQWADANPNVLFQNNDKAYGSEGLGSGKQEKNDYGRLAAKIRAACFLFDITGDEVYRQYFDSHYNQLNLFNWNFAYPFETTHQDMLLYYTKLEGATPSVVSNIKQVYGNSMANGADNLPAHDNKKDPYRAHIKDYTWGSNATKCRQGGMYYNMIHYDTNPGTVEKAEQAALSYINYIHGVNPINFLYLSNMYRHGGKNGVREFYHSWFANGSPLWDRAGISTYGPAPGFLTGGPNPSYNWDACCPSGCYSTQNNAICVSESLIPPREQPSQKSYKDFNTSWPLNSWSVTENSNGYQVSYIRLLSKFVNPEYDCNGDLGGSAIIDICGKCAGGNTGIIPETDLANCEAPFYLGTNLPGMNPFSVYPNPVSNEVKIDASYNQPYRLIVAGLDGNTWITREVAGDVQIDISSLPNGMYILLFVTESGTFSRKIIKN